MKKLIFTFSMIFLTVSFTSQLNAQSKTCTVAQMEACKKICSTATVANCTPAQKAACQKVCSSNTSKVASTEAIQNPFGILVTNNSDQKKTKCCSISQSAKLTKNEVSSCMAKKTKVANNEKPADPIVKQVAMKSTN